MILPITYPSSAEFWLDGSTRKNLDLFAQGQRVATDLPGDFDFRASAEITKLVAKKSGLPTPIFLLSDKLSDRGYHSSYITRAHSHGLPPGSFVHVGNIGMKESSGITHNTELYMATPEFTFLEAARFLSFEDLVILGTELCATYQYDESAAYQQRKRKKLCSVAGITTYLDKAAFMPGIKKACRAAKYILEGSNSPMETKLALLASFPLSLGGYGLPRPVLNGDIILTEEGKRALGYASMRCDLVWEILKIVIEYDSKTCHSGPQEISGDIRRQNALELSGYKLFRISADIFNDQNQLESIFMSIRRAMNLRVDSRLSSRCAQRKNLYSAVDSSCIFSGFGRTARTFGPQHGHPQAMPTPLMQ